MTRASLVRWLRPIVVVCSLQALAEPSMPEADGMKLEALVKRSTFVVVVQPHANLRSMNPPKDAFDGTAFRFVKVLKGAALFDGGTGSSAYPIDRGSPGATDYRPSKRLDDLFPMTVFGDQASRGIVFLNRTSDGQFRLVCPNAFEVVEKQPEIERLVRGS